MKKMILLFLLCGAFLLPEASYAAQPVVTDSRIKTFVYNEYDVYGVLTQYGYQTNIEFGRDEEIVTVSVGDRIGWQIVPVGYRLFIRPMEEGAHTNMTVITTKRSYQFDLSSTTSDKLRPSEELAYVVRFYYPENDDRLRLAPPVQAREVVAATQPPEPVRYNYEYTFTGPDQLAPLKVFDDGHETFLQLQPGAMPGIFAVGPDGKEYPVRAHQGERGLLAVSALAPKLVLRYTESDFVCIYNERM